jgi:3-keto-disaccharide hydrolase
MRLLSCAATLLASCAAVVAADEFKLEPGYKLLFNGKNLDGWQTKGAKPEALTGKTDAYDGRYKVKDGELIIDYKVMGDKYIESVQQFGGDFTIRFDFKPSEGCNNDILLLGTKFDIRAGGKDGLKGVKVEEWSKMEIVVKGGSADFNVNGEKLSTQKTKGDKGPLTIRAEFGPIIIKNLRATDAK